MMKMKKLEKYIQKTVKRIKHFFIQTKTAINVDGIAYDQDEVSFTIRIPYHSLTKGFTRFLNIITIGKKYEMSRSNTYYLLEFPKDPKEEESEEVESETKNQSNRDTTAVSSMFKG